MRISVFGLLSAADDDDTGDGRSGAARAADRDALGAAGAAATGERAAPDSSDAVSALARCLRGTSVLDSRVS